MLISDSIRSKLNIVGKYYICLLFRNSTNSLVNY